MNTELLETCRGFKRIIEETVREVGHLPELYEDAPSEKYIKTKEIKANTFLIELPNVGVHSSSIFSYPHKSFYRVIFFRPTYSSIYRLGHAFYMSHTFTPISTNACTQFHYIYNNITL